MDAFEILVIVLSTLLAVGLVLTIVALVLFVAILRQLKHVAEKAALVAENVETATEFFKNTSMSAAAIKLFSNVTELVGRHKKKGDTK
jgi:hypothetical protein